MSPKMNARGWQLGLLLATLLTTALVAPASNAAELKNWRHGVVEAKSDAGFVFMASRGGFA